MPRRERDMEGIIYTGVPSKEELEHCPGVPGRERMDRGRVACIECVQEIPCNPCESICKFGAITVGNPITNLPHLDGEKCVGCGLCVANCPGLAITVINRAYSEDEAAIDFPYEYLPLPREGDTVDAVNRAGETVCQGRVLKVSKIPAYAGTAVISLAVPKEQIDEVRSMKRLPREEEDE
jgi:Fe-S-cluster-containing hydrogenase component 2